MDFLTLMNWTSPFPILGLLQCGIFHFGSNLKKKLLLANSREPGFALLADVPFMGQSNQQHFVWHDLHPNCLQMLSVNDKSRQNVK